MIVSGGHQRNPAIHIHTYTYACIHSPPDFSPIQAATQHWAEFPVPFSRSLVFIHFRYSRMPCARFFILRRYCIFTTALKARGIHRNASPAFINPTVTGPVRLCKTGLALIAPTPQVHEREEIQIKLNLPGFLAKMKEIFFFSQGRKPFFINRVQ